MDDALNLYWAGEEELRQSLRLFIELLIRLEHHPNVTFIELYGLLIVGQTQPSAIQANTVETFLDRAVPAVLSGAIPEGQLTVNDTEPHRFRCPQAHRNGMVSLELPDSPEWREVAVATAADLATAVKFEFTT